jgi:hypothetical protein
MEAISNKLTFLPLLTFSSCIQADDAKKNLLSGDRDLIIESAIWIKENEVKNSSIVVQLLTHILDGRISSSVTYYMKTPYLARISALEKVTGIKYPFKIDEEPDAMVVDYYLDWAVKKRFIKTKDDIDVVPPFVKEVNDSQTFKKHILNQEKVSWLDKYSWERPPPDTKRFHN